jgi:phospholipid/cholesterol/gamma-HCH transport system ATP-binding protein
MADEGKREEKVCRNADEPMIRIREVHKSFGKVHVLRGVNLEVKCGENMVVIGGSGTGKSVLLKCIIGLLHHDQGEITVDGQEISRLKEKEWNRLLRKFGMVFQRDALFDSISIWENVGFGLRQHTALTDGEIKAIAVEKLKLVGLQDIEDRMPAELSGGMRKRVSLARAIAMDPSIILYDEPTTGLDPVMANVINELMVRMREVLAVTSVVITHDMESAYHIADHIAMLYKGEIIQVGTPEEIRNTGDEIVRQFIQGMVEGPITRGRDFGRIELHPGRRRS